MLNLFQYSFVVRGLETGLIIAIIAPLIGMFLVLKRYSLIADTLSHVSLAGVALGLLFGLNPIMTAIGVSAVSSLLIEKLRTSKKVYGESALALFLSGSLALAVILIGLAHGFSVNLLNYLFGSIMTVKSADVLIIGITGLIVAALVFLFFRQLVYVTFDEESARVSGIPVNFINILLILLAALTVALSIPIVGILLVSALMVIPVVTALQFKKSFGKTLLLAEIFSVFSVVAGIVISFYLNLATGGTIVIVSIIIFFIVILLKK